MKTDEENIVREYIAKNIVWSDPNVDTTTCSVSFFKEKNIPIMTILLTSEENAEQLAGGMRAGKRIYQMDTPIRQCFHVEHEEGSTAVFIKGDIWNAFRIIKNAELLSQNLIQSIESNKIAVKFIDEALGFTFKNKFQTMVTALAKVDRVKAIEKLAMECRGTAIYLCTPREGWKDRALHLAVDSVNAQTPTLIEAVSNQLNYSHSKPGKRVMWHIPEMYADEILAGGVAITEKNFRDNKISGFFCEYYGGFARLFKESRPFENEQIEEKAMALDTGRKVSK